MKKKRAPEPSRYRLFLKPAVHKARKRLPGNVRHRIGRGIDELRHNPRPPKSAELRALEGMDPADLHPWEIRRLRVEDYRVIYAISETWEEITVLAIEKRPPYDYEDLERLLGELLD